MSKKIAAGVFAAALLAAPASVLVGGTTPVAAAELECESGFVASPTTTDGVRLFKEPKHFADSAGLLTSETCAMSSTGITEDYSNNIAFWEVEHQGERVFAEALKLVVFPEVSPDQLTTFAAVRGEGLVAGPAGAVGKLAEADENVWRIPAAHVFSGVDTKPLVESTPGMVVAASPEITAVGRAGLNSNVNYVPASVDGTTVGWIAQNMIDLLPSETDELHDWTVPDPGYALYESPVDDTPAEVLEAGTEIRTTSEKAGWRYSNVGWIKTPIVEEEPAEADGPSTWDKAKDKAGELWESGKEKGSELLESGKETVAEKKADSKILTTPAMITSVILAGFALVLAFASFVLKPARGLANLTPAGIAKTVAAYVAAPVSFALALVATTIAPWAWVWVPPAAAGVGLVSAIALGVAASRFRGGGAHPDLASLKKALYSPVSIGAGLLVAALSVGGLILSGSGSWLAYVVVGLGAVFAYAGAAFSTKPAGPETETGTDAGPATDADEPAEKKEVLADA